jgi:hypothetical protein
MHVLVTVLSIFGLAILAVWGLVAFIRYVAEDSPYAVPITPGPDASASRDTADEPSSSMSSPNR